LYRYGALSAILFTGFSGSLPSSYAYRSGKGTYPCKAETGALMADGLEEDKQL